MPEIECQVEDVDQESVGVGGSEMELNYDENREMIIEEFEEEDDFAPSKRPKQSLTVGDRLTWSTVEEVRKSKELINSTREITTTREITIGNSSRIIPSMDELLPPTNH